MRYFIEDVNIYKNVNKKGEELQKFVTPLRHYLVADKHSLDELKANIMNHIEQLNLLYPRQKPLTLDVSRHLQGRTWTIWVQGNSDKIAAMIHIAEVSGDIHYSLHPEKTAANVPERHAQSASKAMPKSALDAAKARTCPAQGDHY